MIAAISRIPASRAVLAAASVAVIALAGCASVPMTPVPQDDLPRSLQPVEAVAFTPPPGAFVTINPEVLLGPAAVWTGAPILEGCRGAPALTSGQAKPADCLAEGMAAAGAAPAAAMAARWLSAEDGDPGYLAGWRQEGPVAVATVERPFRANANTETLLIPTSGPAIAIDAAPFAGFERDAHLSGFRARHPNAFPVAPSELILSERHLTGWRLTYGLPLRDCRACADLGRMLTTYDFDSQGVFTGRALILPTN